MIITEELLGKVRSFSKINNDSVLLFHCHACKVNYQKGEPAVFVGNFSELRLLIDASRIIRIAYLSKCRLANFFCSTLISYKFQHFSGAASGQSGKFNLFSIYIYLRRFTSILSTFSSF